MERKIGEIFENNGEWYQCVIGCYCDDCAFKNDNCEERERITLTNKLTKEETTGLCTSKLRSDGKSVIFKKLEKVGEHIEFARGLYFQKYRLVNHTAFYEGDTRLFFNAPTFTFVYIEIKQNQKDMEEKKQCGDTIFRIIARAKEHLFQATNIAEDKKELEVLDSFLLCCWQMGWLKQYEDAEGKKLKPFDLEAAKLGKPVCTRDGRKVRIICFDIEDKDNPIAAAIHIGECESVYLYTNRGEYNKGKEDELDLMMRHEKKEGWIIVSKNAIIYNSLEAAKESFDSDKELCICKVEWEE